MIGGRRREDAVGCRVFVVTDDSRSSVAGWYVCAADFCIDGAVAGAFQLRRVGSNGTDGSELMVAIQHWNRHDKSTTVECLLIDHLLSAEVRC